MNNNKPTFWQSSASRTLSIKAICLGTGRFLRSVLVPVLHEALDNAQPILVQTRSHDFAAFMAQQNGDTYPVDVVQKDGTVHTEHHACTAAFSLGQAAHKKAMYDYLEQNPLRLSIIGIGVTEAGLASPNTQVMRDLSELLQWWYKKRQSGQLSAPATPHGKLCILNTDNVHKNGDLLRSHMQTLLGDNDKTLLDEVVFLNTMVDRIVSHRTGDPMVPRTEPWPAKAVVILDPDGHLPAKFRNLQHLGVHVRSTAVQVQADLALKLRVANGTHTALVHVMALRGILHTNELDGTLTGHSPLLIEYMNALVSDQILPAFGAELKDECIKVFDDWCPRLTHAHFGLSTFFITQNGAAKGGIRLAPTVINLVQKRQAKAITVTMAYAFAVLLRFLTPTQAADSRNVFRGKLALEQTHAGSKHKVDANAKGVTEYADGMQFHVQESWYEFKCDCTVLDQGIGRNLASWLLGLTSPTPQQPAAYMAPVRAYMIASDGGNMQDIADTAQFEAMVQAVATLYARMVAGDDLLIMLQDMSDKQPPYEQGFGTDCVVLVDVPGISHGKPLHYRPSPIPTDSALMRLPLTPPSAYVSCLSSLTTAQVGAVRAAVQSELASTLVIDLHTHLLPPEHYPMCLWGIDELLTYHYLVAEYFMTAPADDTPEAFYRTSKEEQAGTIWCALFVKRTPLSEACRGVVTVLVALGLQAP